MRSSLTPIFCLAILLASACAAQRPTKDQVLLGGSQKSAEQVVVSERSKIHGIAQSLGLSDGTAAMVSGATRHSCLETCQLKDDLCRSSDTICDIAKQHHDAEFSDTCLWASTLCTEAKDSCRRCEP